MFHVPCFINDFTFINPVGNSISHNRLFLQATFHDVCYSYTASLAILQRTASSIEDIERFLPYR